MLSSSLWAAYTGDDYSHVSLCLDALCGSCCGMLSLPPQEVDLGTPSWKGIRSIIQIEDCLVDQMPFRTDSLLGRPAFVARQSAYEKENS